jgi:aminoglycoside phosphotransferase (APT) family kinase protein
MRRDVYYWKCDRPAAFHGTGARRDAAALAARLAPRVSAALGAQVALRDAGSQGNHLTFHVDAGNNAYFLRVDDGPDDDRHLVVESQVQERVRGTGVPTPRVLHVDADRRVVPCAWQLLELVRAPDLNHWFKQGGLDLARVANEIGAAVAHWQSVPVSGFGHFDPAYVLEASTLAGHHVRHEDYFFLRLADHLRFLVERGFLAQDVADAIADALDAQRSLLRLDAGCLVHKDLALWNILGTPEAILAYIDWDDAIAGDALDDLSLLGCFHDGRVIARALAGYRGVRPLPEAWQRRFWMHLLRNMIVKAVIRVGAGYFERDDGFFLIGRGGSGNDLRRETLARIRRALAGLQADEAPEAL